MKEKTDTGILDVNGCEILLGDTVEYPYVDPMGKFHLDSPDGKETVMFKHGCFGIMKNYRFEPLMEFLKPIGKQYVPNVGEVVELSNQSILRVV